MNADSQQTSAFYDRVWQDWGELELASPAAAHRRRLVLEHVRDHAAEATRVLEVGCGLGRLLATLAVALPAAKLSGADVSVRSLEAAQRACPAAELFLLDLEAPDFEARHAARFGSFDLVICSEVLEHLGNDARALGRIRALLADQGRLIVTVPGGVRTRFDVAIGHVRHYTRDSLGVLLRNGGYEVERLIAWGFPFHSLYRCAVRGASRVSLGRQGAPSLPRGALSFGYRLFGRLLMPLYFLNRPYWGEQLVAVANKAA